MNFVPLRLSPDRDVTFSIMKGIAIIMVVIGHVINNDTFVNQFHLATFFFVSGYFLKDDHIVDLKAFCWKKFKHLYVPFMKYGLLFVFLHNLLYYIHIESNLYDCATAFHEIRNFTIGMTSEEPLLGAMWFCPALLVVSILSASVLKVVKRQNRIFLKILLLISIPLLGAFLNKVNIKSPRCVWEYMQICGIYYVGYYFKVWKWKKFEGNKIAMGGVIIIAAILINTMNECGYYANLQSLAIRKENVALITLMGGIGAISVFYMAHLTAGIPVIRNVMAIVGEHSFSIMALHFLCFKIVSWAFCLIYNEPFSIMTEFPTIKRAITIYWQLAYITIGVFVPTIIGIAYNWLQLKVRKR